MQSRVQSSQESRIGEWLKDCRLQQWTGGFGRRPFAFGTPRFTRGPYGHLSLWQSQWEDYFPGPRFGAVFASVLGCTQASHFFPPLLQVFPLTDRIRSRGAGVWRPAFVNWLYATGARLAVATGLTGACTLAFICYAAATLVAAFHFLAHPFQSGLAASAPAWLNNGALREPGTLVILLSLPVMVIVIVVVVIVIVVFVLLNRNDRRGRG